MERQTTVKNDIDKRMDWLVNNERSSCRWVAYVVALALGILLMCGALCVAGCSTLTQDEIARLDKIFWEWVERQEAKGETPPSAEPIPDTPTPPPTPEQPPADASDAVAYSSLQWRYGGFNGANAKLDSPRISNLSIKNGNRVYYKWDVGLSGWGLGHTDPGAICAVFFERDGQWIGGKFDWVSVSRTNRELKHVESYSNWPSSGIKLPWRGKVAFVVVSADGRRRSNVLVTEAK